MISTTVGIRTVAITETDNNNEGKTLTEFFAQRGHAVDGVPSVRGARDAESECEIEALHQLHIQWKE